MMAKLGQDEKDKGVSDRIRSSDSSIRSSLPHGRLTPLVSPRLACVESKPIHIYFTLLCVTNQMLQAGPCELTVKYINKA